MKTDEAVPLLSLEEADVSSLLVRLAKDLMENLERAVPPARKGHPRAVRAFVRNWRDLEQRVLGECAREAPDLVVRTEDGFMLADIKGTPSPFLAEILDQEALHAPFSSWVQARGEGEGVALHLVAAVRRLVGGAPMLPPRDFTALRVLEASERGLDPSRFLRIAYQELESGMPELEKVADSFALSDTELARLFGVSRQRIAQWKVEGVPAGHQGKLNAMARLAEILRHNLLPDRIPGIVRESAPALDARSMLDLIAEGRLDYLLARVEDSFDWAKVD
ncbi:MAG: hypothetical protein ACREA0_13175 [bacterium]